MKPILSRRELFHVLGTGAALLGLGGSRALAAPSRESTEAATPAAAPSAASVHPGRGIVAEPAKIPPSTHGRTHAIHHEIELEAREVESEIEPGAKFTYMTYNGQVPGPMLRVRRGDIITLTLHNAANSRTWHNVDLHAVYGPGGGAAALTVLPGQTRTITFKTMYPGAFIYHCAVPGEMDVHISRGMYGMIVVEPEAGLPRVDREFYLGQNESYTKQRPRTPGPRIFDSERLLAEDPTYVTFNGAFNALTRTGYGAMKAKVGETVRVFMVNGGPNLLSSFHAIGNVWVRAWPAGALAMPPMRDQQTVAVPPGSTIVADMELPVPETIKIIDHALTRAMNKGVLAEIEVTGASNQEVFKVDTNA